jgi:hypothetical protein
MISASRGTCGLSHAIRPIGVGKPAEQLPRSHVHGRLPEPYLLTYSSSFDGVALLWYFGISHGRLL